MDTLYRPQSVRFGFLDDGEPVSGDEMPVARSGLKRGSGRSPKSVYPFPNGYHAGQESAPINEQHPLHSPKSAVSLASSVVAIQQPPMKISSQPETTTSSMICHGNISHGRPMDTSGQIAPPGMKPGVTATLWEEKGTLCFNIEARGVTVGRCEDNHMINGTKLLNVAGMTRGRKDGTLKSGKVRHVVKIGPTALKGVW